MKLLKSFGHAWNGIRYCYQSQLNFRIHLVVLLPVATAGFVLRINHTEWLFIIVCSMLVLGFEMLNTAIELMCDLVTTNIHPLIKLIKDATAGAVLMVAAGSVVTGVIIFLPKIINLLKLLS